MLWLSLHLPRLPLEVYTRAGVDPDQPLVVIEGNGTRRQVYACNAAAAEKGVAPGMRSEAARSLLGTGRLLPRRADAEQAALQHLADWAGQFTSTLSLHPPDALLLEIGGSLTLFQGLESLLRQIREEIADLGYEVFLGTAPTPIGAWLLAANGYGKPVLDQRELESCLALLPLESLPLPSSTLAALHGMGLRRLGECLRLPTAGLTRRLGSELVTYLYKALGRLPDPRPRYASPERFTNRLLLPSEVDNTEALLFAARRLLLELIGFLRGRSLGIRQFHLMLFHRTLPPTQLEIGLLAPSRDPDHLLGLLKTRLEPFRLPAPVEEIGIEANEFHPLDGAAPALFESAEKAMEDGARLIERLRARLGPEAVAGHRVIADHRPEYAWRSCSPGEQGESYQFGPRPTFLFPKPEPLQTQDGYPYRNGPLTFLLGPERIESGWWDGRPVRRDYFVVTAVDHSRWWIFRDLQGGDWYLHGVFA